MRYCEYAPARQLAAIVERYWYLDAPVNGVERIFPDGHAELVLHLGGTVHGQASTLLIGQMTQPVDIVPEGYLRVFGVRLRPEAAMRVQPVAGQILDLTDAWSDARQWRERMGHAASDSERVTLADIRAAFARHVKPAEFAIVVVGAQQP